MSTTPSTAEERIIHVPDVIPIFPLPKTVMLPGEVLPLHIFEPRYCEMVAHAIARTRVIGMVEVSPGFEGQHLGDPPVERIGCVGIIRDYSKLDDGRYLLWLFGLQRFEIDTEIDVDTSYRQARVRYPTASSVPEDLATLAPMRRELRDLVPGLVDVDDDTRVKLRASIAQIDDSQLIALATQVLQIDNNRKRQILEAPSAGHRFKLVFEDLYRTLEDSSELAEVNPDRLN